MSTATNNLSTLIEKLQASCPHYLTLISSENEQEFLDAFYTYLGEAIKHLEKNAKNKTGQNENSFSADIAGYMNMPGVRVFQENFSGGHVDLTFEVGLDESRKTILGEAKIYDGYSYHKKGLGQLIGRYLTGRENQGVIIEYFKKKGIKFLMEKLKQDLDTDKPYGQEELAETHMLKWGFISKHQHSSGEVMAVSHLGCNLYDESKG